MLKLTLLIVTGFAMAAETPKTPPAAPPQSAKLTTSEAFALQTIAQKIADLTKALDEAKAFQQTLFRDDCMVRKIDLSVCQFNPADGTIIAVVPNRPVAPVVAKTEEPKK